MRKQRELTTAEKWAEVDAIERNIKRRRESGEAGCITPIDEYIDSEFTNRKDDA